MDWALGFCLTPLEMGGGARRTVEGRVGTMNVLRRKLPSLLGAAALAAAFMTAGAATAAASGATCAGGSVAGGAYESLTITGFCSVDSGLVEVRHNLTVAPGGILNATFSGSNLKVGQNLLVKSTGILVLGCEPFASPWS